MDFRAELSMAVDVVLDTFGEEVGLRGECIRGVVRDTPYSSAGLEVAINGRSLEVSISDADAARLALVKDEPIEVRGKQHAVRDFAPNGFGMTIIEVG